MQEIELVKDGSNTELTSNIELSSLEDVISTMIDFYQAVFVHPDNWLTKQERKFFVACVMISNLKLKYTSSRAKRIFKEVFNLKRQSDVRGYLGDLEQKGILTSNVRTKDIEIHEFFKFDLTAQKLRLEVTLNYENGSIRGYNSGNQGN